MGIASSDSEKSLKGFAFTSASTFICCCSMGELSTHQRLPSLNDTCALLRLGGKELVYQPHTHFCNLISAFCNKFLKQLFCPMAQKQYIYINVTRDTYCVSRKVGENIRGTITEKGNRWWKMKEKKGEEG